MVNKYKISAFARVITGGTPSTAKKEYWENGNIPWLNSGELNQDVITGSSNFITECGLKSSNAKLMPPETVLIALTGATTGKVGFLTFEACANQSVTGILPSDRHDPKYLYYYLNSIRNKVLNDSYGGAQKHISQSYVQNIEVPLPSLAVQQKIAAILDKADSLRQKDKQLLKLYDDFAQSVFYEMFGDPTRNPRNFSVRSLPEFYYSKEEGTRCGPFGSALKKDEYKATGIPVWTMDNILLNGEFKEEGCLSIDESKFRLLKNYATRNGDIIISRAGTVGKMCVIRTKSPDSLISTNLIRLRLAEDLDPIFFVSLMRYFGAKIARLRTGGDAAFTHMNTGILDSIEFPYPPLSEQLKYNAFYLALQRSKKQINQTIEKSDALFRSLAQQAFSSP
jgi:type I restriction enzyme, S subunit